VSDQARHEADGVGGHEADGVGVALARFTAASRIAIGAAFLVQPQVWMRPWIGADASRPGSRLVARALGARDVALGVGTLASAGRERRRWLVGALLADGADLLLTIGAREQLPPRGRLLVSLIAGAGVGLGAVAAAQVP
jgi:hypothetical protein